MGKRAFKKYIQSMSRDEIIGFMLNLYDQFPVFKTVIDSSIDEEFEEKTFEKYRKKLVKVFRDPENFSLGAAEAVVNDYEGIGSTKRIIEMKLIFAQLLSDFTSDFGDMGYGFYRKLTSVAMQVLKYAEKDEEFFNYHKEDLEHLIDSCDRFGYGVYQNLEDEWERVQENY